MPDLNQWKEGSEDFFKSANDDSGTSFWYRFSFNYRFGRFEDPPAEPEVFNNEKGCACCDRIAIIRRCDYALLGPKIDESLNCCHFYKCIKRFLSSVRKGDKCLAAYGPDWCRATVLSIEADGTYMVRYVDYGNCEAVPLQKLRALPDSLNTKPLAVKCALEGVVENAISLEQCQIALFHKTFTVKVVMKTDQHLFVRMTASDGTDVITSLELLAWSYF